MMSAGSSQDASPNGKFIIDTLGSSSGRALIFRDTENLTVPRVVILCDPSISPSHYDPISSLTRAYLSGGISIGRAAEILRLCYDDLISEVEARGMKLPMGPQTLEEFRSENETLRSYLRSR